MIPHGQYVLQEGDSSLVLFCPGEQTERGPRHVLRKRGRDGVPDLPVLLAARAVEDEVVGEALERGRLAHCDPTHERGDSDGR